MSNGLERGEYLTKFIKKWSLLAAAAVVVQWVLLTLLPWSLVCRSDSAESVLILPWSPCTPLPFHISRYTQYFSEYRCGKFEFRHTSIFML